MSHVLPTPSPFASPLATAMRERAHYMTGDNTPVRDTVDTLCDEVERLHAIVANVCQHVQSGLPMVVDGKSIDLTDDFKVRMYDKLREVLYRDRAGDVSNANASQQGTTPEVARPERQECVRTSE